MKGRLCHEKLGLQVKLMNSVETPSVQEAADSQSEPSRMEIFEEESEEQEELSSLGVFRERASAIWSQLTPSEISGSLGDLGTFIPLYVALCRQGSLHGRLSMSIRMTPCYVVAFVDH